MFFVVGSLILFFFSMMMKNIFYMWMLMESVFFLVIFFLIKNSGGEVNLNSIIFYLFIQALGGVLLLSSMLVEMFYFGNYYFLNSSASLGCLYLSIMGVFLKMGVFPFYLQVYQIMSFINFRQILFFMLFPKIVPGIMMYNMVGQLDLGGGALLFPFLVVFISSIQSLKSSDLREFLAWSGLSQLSWIFVSILGSFFSFFFFFYMYVIVLSYFCFLLEKGGKKLFYDFFGAWGDLEGGYVVLFLVFFMSSLAPFLMFYLKLFLLFNLNNLSLAMVGLLLVGSMGMFLFYVRVLQLLICMGSSFFYNISFMEFSFYKSYFGSLMIFFFGLGGLLFLI